MLSQAGGRPIFAGPISLIATDNAQSASSHVTKFFVTLTNRFVILRRMRERLSGTVNDARLAVRLWTRRPALAAVVIGTIALGVGAPTAMFSVIDAVLLQPLPYDDPHRIVSFRIESQGPRGSVSFDAIPATMAAQWTLDTDTLSGISLYNDRALTLSTSDGPFRLAGTSITPNAFAVLGARPLLGNPFEAGTTDTRRVILAFDTWQRFFPGRRDLVGSSITLDGESYLVAGVMPPDFDFPTGDAAFWVPLLMEPGGGRGMLLPSIARLRAGATVAAVEAEGRRQLAGEDQGPQRMTLHARTFHDQLVGGNRQLLWTLMAAVSMVSVIATTNIALLLLVRGASRSREFSIRLAAGAPRGRLVQQLLVEAAMLAAGGGAAGVGLAAALLSILLQFAPPEIPRLQDAALNRSVLLFALLLTAATSLVFGILSAGRTVTIDIVRALTGGSGDSALHASASPRARLHVLAVAEVMLTLVLLVGAGLLLRSFMSLLRIDHGFNPSGTLAFQVSLPLSRYPTQENRMAFQQRLLERVSQLAAVDVAGIAITMPNRQPSARFAYDPIGVPLIEDPATLKVAEVRTVSEGFFEAMGMSVRAGRSFRATDAAGAEPVMVINERLARVHFGDDDPVGRMLYSGSGTRRVIGVVGDVRPAARGTEPGPAAYLPLKQDAGVFRWFGTLNVVLRGDDLSSIVPELRAMVLSLDPEMPPFNVRTLDQEVARLFAGSRFSASALAAFSAMALVLAAIGLYGVVAYAAGQRTREFGVRIALGASRSQVLWLVIRDGLRVIGIGLVAGLLAAIWLAQTLTGLLHNVQPADPVALGSVAALLAAVGLLAVYVPALRATRVNALDALRAE
jgi:putative ABC transport system permease protein